MADHAILSSIPEKAVHAFEHYTGLRLTIHDLDRSLGLHLPPDRFTHHFGQCRRFKHGPLDRYCVQFEITRLRPQLASLRAGRCHLCHAGLVEWVVPVFDGDHLLWVLFAGSRTPGPDLKRLACDSDSNLHSDLIPPQELPAPVNDNESALILEALHQLASRLQLWRTTSQPIIPAPADQPRAYRIHEFIRTHFQEPLTIGDLARHLHLSPGRTAHLVSEACGAGFVDLLTETRLRHASELLRHTSERISEVASRSGFPDVSHFHRTFRQRMGVSPARYRRQRE